MNGTAELPDAPNLPMWDGKIARQYGVLGRKFQEEVDLHQRGSISIDPVFAMTFVPPGDG